MRMESPLNQRLRRSPPDVVYTPIDVTSLQLSRKRIVAVQEEARKHIAEELHGPVQTRLSELHLRLGEMGEMIETSSREVQKELGKTAADLDSVREKEIRMISHGLHTSIIDVGLQAGIETLRDQFERRVPIALRIAREVVALDPPGSSTIPFNVRLGLYRVAHEALANVIKHAGATQVAVDLSLGEDAGDLVLKVQDDGRGFDPNDAPRGLGLLTMGDYLSEPGGSLDIDTAPGKGTRIVATVPLKYGSAGDLGSSSDRPLTTAAPQP